MKVSWLIPTTIALAVVPAVWWATAARNAAAQDAPAAAGGPVTFMTEAAMNNSCRRCHRSPSEDDIKEGLDRFVILREYNYWHNLDLHRAAFDALSSPLGKRMSVLLYDSPAAAAKKAECLVCHATDTAPSVPLAKKTFEQFQCDLGVNCQSCHGPGQVWVGKHFDPAWRTVAPDAKLAQGLVDLRDPEVRAAKCVSCHIGSTAEGKCVTHEMYAAGHPPLPAFELATFSRDEPRHWRAAADVPYIAGLEPTAARKLFHYRKGEVEAARLAAVGAITSMKESAKLLAFTAPGAGPDDGLDLTHFNCAACHHDLRVNANGISDRQKNGFPGTPGRPVPRNWPVWLARVVLKHAESQNAPDAARVAADFEAKMKGLRAAFDARPFGDAPRVRVAGEQVAVACDDVLKVIDGITYDAASSKALLADIAAAALAEGGAERKDFLDADGAGQLARAYAAITAELAGVGTNPLPAPTEPPTLAGLKPLNAVMPLAARDRYGSGYADGKPKDPNDFLIQATLAPRLKTFYGYTPQEFREAFRAVLTAPPAAK